MYFKRALVRCLKGIFCKLKGRLQEAKRACIDFESWENSLQISANKGKVVCVREVDIAPNYINHVVYPPF